MKLNLFDSHIHSTNSNDGMDSIDFICERALDMHVMGLCITDHFECNGKQTQKYEESIKNSIYETEKARLKYDKRLRITTGIELSAVKVNPEAARHVLSLTNYDFVLSGLHCLSDGSYISDIDYSSPEVVVSDILDTYFKELYSTASWSDYDSLAHLTYPERYIWGDHRIPVRIEEHMDIIDEILKVIIRNGKSLEINTAGIRRGLGKTCPDIPIIKRYRELGGELITIGSDAHKAGHIINGFNDTMDMLLSLGFRYFAFYRQRKPVMLKIL